MVCNLIVNVTAGEHRLFGAINRLQVVVQTIRHTLQLHLADKHRLVRQPATRVRLRQLFIRPCLRGRRSTDCEFRSEFGLVDLELGR